MHIVRAALAPHSGHQGDQLSSVRSPEARTVVIVRCPGQLISANCARAWAHGHYRHFFAPPMLQDVKHQPSTTWRRMHAWHGCCRWQSHWSTGVTLCEGGRMARSPPMLMARRCLAVAPPAAAGVALPSTPTPARASPAAWSTQKTPDSPANQPSPLSSRQGSWAAAS